MEPIEQLEVYLRFTDTPIAVGQMVSHNRTIFFKYDESFIKKGLEISPYKLRLSDAILTPEISIFDGLFGFKLHIVINERGEILDFVMTQGNVDDRQPLRDRTFHDKVFGKIFADRGYIGKDLFEKLFVDGMHLVA